MQGQSAKNSFADFARGTTALLLGVALVAATLCQVHAHIVQPATVQCQGPLDAGMQLGGPPGVARAQNVQATANLNLPSTAGKRLALIPKNTKLTAGATRSGWNQGSLLTKKSAGPRACHCVR